MKKNVVLFDLSLITLLVQMCPFNLYRKLNSKLHWKCDFERLKAEKYGLEQSILSDKNLQWTSGMIYFSYVSCFQKFPLFVIRLWDTYPSNLCYLQYAFLFGSVVSVWTIFFVFGLFMFCYLVMNGYRTHVNLMFSYLIVFLFVCMCFLKLQCMLSQPRHIEYF